MIFFKVFKIKKAVHVKERSGKARSPASGLEGSHGGICDGKKLF
jgi:hypothetical protein